MVYHYKDITPFIRRPIIEIIVKTEDKFAIYPVLIDSGADYCIFSTELAKDRITPRVKTRGFLTLVPSHNVYPDS